MYVRAPCKLSSLSLFLSPQLSHFLVHVSVLSLYHYLFSSFFHHCSIPVKLNLLCVCFLSISTKHLILPKWFHLYISTYFASLYRVGYVGINHYSQGGLCDGLPLVSEWRICLFGFLFFVHSFFCPFLYFFHLSFSIFGLFFRHLFATRLLIRISCLHFNCQL